jgi:small subunit ribosomal protein S27e
MAKEKEIPKPKTKFLQIECPKCGNKQVTFSAPASVVKCLVCENELAASTGSKINLKSKVVRILE